MRRHVRAGPLFAVPHASQRGFSYLELVAVVALIGILLAVALYKLLPYVAQAERVAVQRLEGEIRSTLTMEMAKRIARGESARVIELNGSNPMGLMLEQPVSYLGELRSPEPGSIPKRHWYFDVGSRRLVYRAGNGFALQVLEDQPVQLEYEVHVVFEDGDRNGLFRPGPDTLHGVRLIRVSGPERPDFADAR